MVQIDTSAPILVTGAAGYVAGWVIKELLDAGATVHAAVRNPNNEDKIKHLKALAAGAPGDIKFFRGDLTDQGSYAEGMAGCKVVFHIASPFTTSFKDPQKELIDPAQQGTRNVLEQANATPSVTRVVVTSSCAAIYGDNTDVAEAPGGVLTEAVWNTSSSASHQAYSYSKTVAEREAWKIADAQSRWKLVAVNPSLVLGPGVIVHETSESFSLMRQMGDGSLRSGAPKIGFGVVDVRDLAKAHLAAGFEAGANGRNIISGHNTDLLSIAMTLLDKYGSDYGIPRRAAPKWLIWLLAPLIGAPFTRKVVSRNVNIMWYADNTKGVRELGVTYRPLEQTTNEMFAQMIEAGFVKK